MARVGPIKRSELIRKLRRIGFSGPRSGGRHEFMIRGNVRLTLPNPHQSDIGKGLLARLLSQAGISDEEWESL